MKLARETAIPPHIRLAGTTSISHNFQVNFSFHFPKCQHQPSLNIRTVMNAEEDIHLH